jgi:hypothetical protein
MRRTAQFYTFYCAMGRRELWEDPPWSFKAVCSVSLVQISLSNLHKLWHRLFAIPILPFGQCLRVVCSRPPIRQLGKRSVRPSIFAAVLPPLIRHGSEGQPSSTTPCRCHHQPFRSVVKP